MNNPWIEAMRPRTLPVSVAGVLAGTAVAVACGAFHWIPALICMLFALGAQVTSNFANEYYDWRDGIDAKGREGFRRGVTEGDITPGAMKRATFLTLGLSCLLGCSLIWWGGWWLLPVGILIALFALGYSTGPWPLSHHGMGDVAVVVFFGLVPVTLTAWLQCGSWQTPVLSAGTPTAYPMWQSALMAGLGAGLLAANVLVVNNYRDMESDREAGKITTVVRFGRRTMGRAYAVMGFTGLLLLALALPVRIPATMVGWAVAAVMTVRNCHALKSGSGSGLNAVLGATARLMLVAIAWLTVCAMTLRLP